MTLQKTKLTANDSAFLRQPNHQHLYTVLPEPRPHHSTNHSYARTVQCVSCNHRVTVYPADDYDRIAPRMHAALDRMRFRRRIEQTELILTPVLNKNHRRIIRMCIWIVNIVDCLMRMKIKEKKVVQLSRLLYTHCTSIHTRQHR